jgi:hypothetical protein
MISLDAEATLLLIGILLLTTVLAAFWALECWPVWKDQAVLHSAISRPHSLLEPRL